MKDLKATWRGHAAMLTANILWGLMAPVSKDALNYFSSAGISPFVLPAFRILGATVAFWIASLFMQHEHVPIKDKIKLLIAGLLCIVFNQNMFIVGVSFTEPIDASVITTMLPIATMILAAIVLREPITLLKAGGVVVGMTGALLLILSGGHGLTLDHNHLVGDAMCLASQVSFACYLVFFKNTIARYKPVTLMKWMFLFSTIAYIPFMAGDIAAIDYSSMPTKVCGEILYVVFGGTFFTFFLVPTGQKLLRPTVVSSYNYVQPVVSTIVSLAWGLATFGPLKGVAVTLVFIGVYLVTQSKSRSKLESEKKQ